LLSFSVRSVVTGKYVKMTVFWIVLIWGLADAIYVLALTKTWH